ncbi:Fic family protein [Pseudomonas batumici]|uniref:Fic family protein n=1 Tax=Pseudomonas batumici TaxID=226910 RepID=UPI003D7C1C31
MASRSWGCRGKSRKCAMPLRPMRRCRIGAPRVEMSRLELNHRASFRSTYLGPALVSGCVEMTDPDSPRSPAQKYRLTEKGRARVRP